MNERVLILRDAVVKITQMLSGKGITVTQRGVNAYVKCDNSGRPTLVNLPYLPDNSSEELCLAIQGFLDHEVAHILFSDFGLLDIAAKDGCRSMLNILEDARIEREMAKRFSGSGHNLSVTGKFFLDKYTTPMMQEAAAAGDANKVIGILMVPLIRAMSGQFVFQEFIKDKMHIVQGVYDKIADLESKIQTAASTQDCLRLAKEIESRLRSGHSGSGGEKSDKGEEGGDASDSEVRSMKGEAKDDDGGKPKKQPKKSKSKKESEKSDGEENGEEKEEGSAHKKADADRDESEKSDGEEKSEGDNSDDPENVGDDGEDGGSAANSSDSGEGEDGASGEGSSDSTSSSDESSSGSIEMEDGSSQALWEAIDKENANGFDKDMSVMISESAAAAARRAEYLVYTKDADRVEPLRVGSGYNSKMLVDIADNVDHMVGPLQKDLERAIAARSLATWEAGRRSGRLHAANLSRLAVGDARVFRRKHETVSKDVAVELVIDASGSMSGSKVHLATQAAYALSSVLERIGIQHEVICFTTGAPCADSSTLDSEQKKIGRPFTRIESLYMPVIKGFNERLRTEVKERFGWLPNSNILRNNVDGECVEIAARRLLSRREAGKIMIVLSDGMPNAHGDTGELRRHLKQVIDDVSKKGVKVVGIGIQTDAVRQFYPKNCVINKVNELPEHVVKELRHLLVS